MYLSNNYQNNPLLNPYNNQTQNALNEMRQAISEAKSAQGTDESDENSRETWELPFLDFLSEDEYAQFQKSVDGMSEQEAYNTAKQLQDFSLTLANSLNLTSNAGGMSGLLNNDSSDDDITRLMMQGLQNSISSVYIGRNLDSLREIASTSDENPMEFSNRFFQSLNQPGVLDLSV